MDRQFLAGGGEMGALMRAFDWAGTALGPTETWPQSLRTALSICLNSRFPMVIWWGEELTFLYNDAFIPMLGAKHPGRALGRAGREVWAEVWDVAGPLLERVRTRGEAIWADDLLFLINRSGYTEESYFQFSYSPIRAESGDLGGIFTPVSETTTKVISERRLTTLRKVAEQGSRVKSVHQACLLAEEASAENPHDIPYAAFYLVAKDRSAALLTSGGRSSAWEQALPRDICLKPDTKSLLSAAARSGETTVIQDLRDFGLLPPGFWGDPTQTLVLLPVRLRGESAPTAFLLAAVSTRRALDDGYRDFFEMVAGHIATALANANALEEEHRRAEALAGADRAKTAFFSNVSHEFRTPLTLLLGPLEDTLQGGETLSPQARRQLELAHRNGVRLQKLVNNLLDFSRIEAGRVQAVFQPVDLAALTGDIGSTFRAAVEKAGMRLLIDCHPLPLPVYADREMWEKVVVNLLSNAFKYTLAGEIRVGLRAENNSAIFSVEDTGIGIAEEELPLIFDRFHRVEGAHGRTQESTGIGLALVQELVKLHGGSVQVRSVKGKGSVFSVEIPSGTAHLSARQISNMRNLPEAARGPGAYVPDALHWLPGAEYGEEDAYPARQPAAQANHAGGAKPRIVLADDNADMRNYVSRLLRAEFDVIAVRDGQQALAAVLEHSPDLVLTDIMMPNLDGFGLLKAIRSVPEHAGTPVIMLSARAGEEATVEGLQRGADDYIVKPFSARELLARVKGTLSLATLRAEAIRREAELRAETIDVLENITDAFAAVNAEWNFTYVNAETERIFGRKRDEYVGRSLWEVFGPLVGTVFEKQYRRTMTERVPTHTEAYYANLKNWFDVSANPLKDGGVGFYFRQVTEQHHAKVLVAGQKQALELAVSGAPLADVLTALTRTAEEQLDGARAAIFTVSADGGHLDLPSIASIPELCTQSRDGFPVGQEYPPCGEAAFTGKMQIAGDVWNDPLWSSYLSLAREADIGACWSQPIFSTSGKVLGSLATYFRIPREPEPQELESLRFLAQTAGILIERQQESEVRIKAERELRQANSDLEQFAHSASHDLQEPLRMVGIYSQLLQRNYQGKLDSTADEFIGHCVEGVRRMDTLIQDLLVYAQSAGTADRPSETVDLERILEKALSNLQAAIRENEAEVTHDPLPWLAIEPVRIQQLFQNLIGNAIKYRRAEVVPKIHIAANKVRDEWCFSVSDNGIGIEAEYREDVFGLFKRLHEDKSSGTGLGLAICKRTVERYGGRIWVESEPGRGSTFLFSLPVSLEKPGRGTDAQVQRRPADHANVIVESGQSDKRFRLMADSAPVLIWLADTTKQCTFFNRTWLEFTGRTQEQEYGYGWAEGVHPDDLKRCLETYERAFDRREAFEMDYRLLRHDGEWRWILDHGVPLDSNGIFSGYIGSCIDITDRKVMEVEHRRLVSVVENSSDFIGIADNSGVPVYVNRAGLTLVGAESFEECRKTPVQDFFVPEEREFIQNVVLPAVSETGTWKGELRFRHFRTAEPVPVLYEVFRVDDPYTGKAVNFATVARDITDRKRSEEVLRKSEARFRAAVQATSSLLWTNNAKGEMEGEQVAWGEFTGQSEREYRGFGWTKAVHPDDAQPTLDAWYQAVAGKCLFVFEHRVRRHDGVWRLFSIRAVPVFDAQGSLSEWVGVHNDITEERALMDGLLQSEARFRQLADAMPQMVWTTDKEGHPDYFNERWYEFTGNDRTRFVAISRETGLHPDDVVHSSGSWNDSVRTGEPFRVEYRFWDRREIRWRWFLGRALPVRDGSGEIVKWFGTYTDIDDQKRVEEDLRRAHRILEEFAYAASHELQEPLRNVAVYSELLTQRYGAQLDPDAARFFGFLADGAHHMKQLVEDLLAYMQVATVIVQPGEPADTEEALQKVLSNVSAAVAECGARITWGPMPKVRVQEFHLRQLFQGVIGNTLKYRKYQSAPEVRIAAELEHGFWRFSVRDNGIGIEPEYHLKIFGLFKRLHGREEYPGTGSGLAVCQNIVERYGGKMWVESELGQGSTFLFTLPE